MAWSGDGKLIAVSSISGSLTVYEAATRSPIGRQHMQEVGNPGTIPTPRMVTAIAFESPNALRVTMCNRPRARPRDTPYDQCGPDVTSASVSLALQVTRFRAGGV